jgi:hypothetical protein
LLIKRNMNWLKSVADKVPFFLKNLLILYYKFESYDKFYNQNLHYSPKISFINIKMK